LYKTGDLARFLPDGNIEYFGRIDYQVKIRGFRIELEEIESGLTKHPAVEQAVVLAKKDKSGECRLVAYLVFDHKPVPSGGELRDFLKARLPDYMIPGFFVPLEALPLTTSGKLNRRGLPEPEGLKLAAETNYVKPGTEIERKLADLWQEVLNQNRVGVHDNFFDLGGHSLTMVNVHNQLSELLKRDISIIDLFKYPTIHSLAQFLSQEQDKQPIFIEKQQRAVRQREAVDIQKQRLKNRRVAK
jgi:acyl carrier protein